METGNMASCPNRAEEGGVTFFGLFAGPDILPAFKPR
jgi:hypothetical protein